MPQKIELFFEAVYFLIIMNDNHNQKVKVDNIIYSIDEETQTACAIDISTYPSLFNIFIPRSIQYQSHEYIVTTLKWFATRRTEQYTLNFAPDSEIKKIGHGIISGTSIVSLTIPPSVTILGEEWCDSTSNLIKVIIMPNNPRYKNYDEKMVIGKSDIESDEYDVLVFVSRDVQSVTIPSNIKIIGPNSFDNSQIESISISPHITRICTHAFNFCTKLKSVEIPPDSELQVIEDYAFIETKIERIFIPPHLTELGKGAFFDCESNRRVEIPPNSELRKIGESAFSDNPIESLCLPSTVSILEEGCFSNLPTLTKLTLMPNNPHFMYIDNKYLVGKSVENSDEYDVLLFVRRDLHKAIIPSFIKRIAALAFDYSSVNYIYIPPSVEEIGYNAFFWCTELEHVEISPDSELKSIESYIFEYSTIKSFTIPSKLTKIPEFCFEDTECLEYVDFQPNSQLEVIDKHAFCNSAIKSIIIPPSVQKIDPNAFEQCFSLQIVEFDEKSNIKMIEEINFQFIKEQILMIPSKLVKSKPFRNKDAIIDFFWRYL